MGKTWYGVVLTVFAFLLISPRPSNGGERNKSSKVGIGVKVSSLGAGIEAAVPVFGKLNVRGGFNAINYSHPFHQDGITYNGNLSWRSGEASLDWFPFGEFHVSPGVIFYNGNKVTATALVPGSQSFTLNGVSYTSDPTSPISGAGNVVVRRAAPKITLGFGNLIPRSGRRLSFLAEVGVAYQGAPQSALAFQGNACNSGGCVNAATNPAVLANIAAEQTKINDNLSPLRFHPIISVGFGFNF